MRKSLNNFVQPRVRQLLGAPGFTLVELLLVVAILALLLGVLLPALSRTIGSARQFKCQMSLRSVAFDFTVFADDQLHGPRGLDETELPRGKFRLETFQNSQYGIGEFWNYGNVSTVSLPDAQGRDPMRCASVKGDLLLRRNVPCSQGGVSPSQNVSYTFNMRLTISERQALAGQAPGVLLSSKIMDGSWGSTPGVIPLVWDVDGAVAGQRGFTPVYSAPARSSTMIFLGNRYWFPGMRHNGAMNTAFVDGHVASSARPLDERLWAWEFEPTH